MIWSKVTKYTTYWCTLTFCVFVIPWLTDAPSHFIAIPSLTDEPSLFAFQPFQHLRCLPTFPTNEWCTPVFCLLQLFQQWMMHPSFLFVSAVPAMNDAPQLFVFQLFWQWMMHPSFFVCFSCSSNEWCTPAFCLLQLFQQWVMHPSFLCFSCSSNEWCTLAFLFVSAVPAMNDAPQLFVCFAVPAMNDDDELMLNVLRCHETY